jgi:plastocyanin
MTNIQDQTQADAFVVDPKAQTKMFDNFEQEATRIDIQHDDSAFTNATTETEETVPKVTKVKILAAIAILATAGYLAYWVQEPVEVKSDVLNQPAVESTMVAAAETTPTDTVAVAGETKEVDLSLFGFEPAVLTIEKGTTVKWTNTSSEKQTIIGDGTAGTTFTSPELASGESYSQTFDKDEEVEYYSTYSPALKAKITVGSGTTVTDDVTTTTAVTDTATDAPVIDTTTEAPAVITSTTTAIPTLTSTSTSDSAILFGAADETDVAVTSAPADTAVEEATATESETVAMTDEEKATQALAESTEHAAAATDEKGKLAKTGPEDAIYLAAFGFILFINRKKLGLVK